MFFSQSDLWFADYFGLKKTMFSRLYFCLIMYIQHSSIDMYSFKFLSFYLKHEPMMFGCGGDCLEQSNHIHHDHLISLEMFCPGFYSRFFAIFPGNCWLTISRGGHVGLRDCGTVGGNKLWLWQSQASPDPSSQWGVRSQGPSQAPDCLADPCPPLAWSILAWPARWNINFRKKTENCTTKL